MNDMYGTEEAFINAMIKAGWTPRWEGRGPEARVVDFRHRTGRTEEYDSAYRFWTFTRGKYTIMPW